MHQTTCSDDTYILALDSGTTSVRSILFDTHGTPVAQASQPITQHYPQPGWVEHDAREILAKQVSTISEVQFASGIHSDRIAAVGITNQRETVVVWDRHTGEPISNAIVWQCRRTEPIIASMRERGLSDLIAQKTGLVLDPYFSASKIAWILDNVPGARERAEAWQLACGTIDCWLIWNLTEGAVHATDRTNASRTMLFNIHTMDWDDELLDLFNIPRAILPEVKESMGDYGQVSQDIMRLQPPILGVAGDQQASLFGHCCFEEGQAKATYGTGCFILMNTGTHAVPSKNGLVTTVAASTKGELRYALEGSVFNAGSTIQWLRDELGLIKEASETEELALSVTDTAGTYLVPAFTGLGAPWWDAEARGLICGLTRGCTRAHLARAALESIAYQAYDVLEAMRNDFPCDIEELAVDGGGSQNRFTMGWQAGLLQRPVVRPKTAEVTALGAAYLAGLNAGYWKDLDSLRANAVQATRFKPELAAELRQQSLDGWYRALNRARG